MVSKITRRVLVFCLLTILTQIGGLIYILNFSLYPLINKKVSSVWARVLSKLSSFVLFYCIATFLIVPIIAKTLDRVPLPLTTENHLRPLNIWTCILNRNYVRPELREVAFGVASEMNKKHPGTITNYLEANFPFINRFPLIPHLSHNDGKKLDLSFCYNDSKTGQETNEAPSFIGYGICEEPTLEETNTAEFCAEQGYWRYSFMKYIIPQGPKKDFIFNEQKTKDLVNLFARKDAIGRIFIEPHLKKRMKLTNEKLKFHGCHAVRHDDHVHVQLW